MEWESMPSRTVMMKKRMKKVKVLFSTSWREEDMRMRMKMFCLFLSFFPPSVERHRHRVEEMDLRKRERKRKRKRKRERKRKRRRRGPRDRPSRGSEDKEGS